MKPLNGAAVHSHQSIILAFHNHSPGIFHLLAVLSHTPGFFSMFSLCVAHTSAATKLALVLVSIKTFSLFPSNFTLVKEILNCLLSIAAFFGCFLFRVVVHLSFLAF